MSSKLKKKTKSKHNLYNKHKAEVRDELCRRKRVAKSSFSETFKSAQLINFCVMYTDFDFEKRKMKNFQNRFLAHNDLLDGLDDDGTNKLIKAEMKIKESIGFDCEKEARNFPYRAKMKMCGLSLKGRNIVDMEVARNNASDSLEAYLILVITTMRDNYRFSKKNVFLWWEKFTEVAMLYAKGMTDDFVVKYITETLEWDLEMC